MNLTRTQAAAAVEAFVKLVNSKSTVDVVVCPPYVNIQTVHDLLKHTHIELGAQDVFWKDSGAFTGRISAPMLVDLGVTHCIVGHSETRGKFGKLEIDPADVAQFPETDHTVNLKLKALLFHNLAPILCVGETLAEREAGKTDGVILTQLKGALEGVDPVELHKLCVAYEPVWAIGTGKTCDPDEANRVCGVIRAALVEMLGAAAAEPVRILYGGSVKSSNSKVLFSQPNIDGGLVGGACLDPHEFSLIVLSA